MCCSWSEVGEIVDECMECGAAIDADGNAGGCGYSPVVCEECGYAPCDGSC